ncbi:DUF1513 domain-containing protein [Zhengella mangrovi]|nr:DUF1513 domain-containing protein [Zhengella mangrovi]
MNGHVIDRRAFLAGAGYAFLSALAPRGAEAAMTGDALIASACRFADGAYGAVLLNERGETVTRVDLPARGHDVAVHPDGGLFVAFARRPGNFALAFHPAGGVEPVAFHAPEGRHFFGHGAFSRNGRLLYATENDYETASGVVGVYDAGSRFRRIGEFDSHGTGPHEILLLPDGRTLAVCNGGIETHPDFGRAKLNIDRMKPSLVFIDAATGRLIERHEPPAALHQLSIRHMAAAPDGRVLFGCQYEGPATDLPPLWGTAAPGETMRLFERPAGEVAAFRNYVGSVALSADGSTLALSSPRGNLVAWASPADGRILKSETLHDGCGIAFLDAGLVSSSGDGTFHRGSLDRTCGFAFDNHLAVAAPRTG